MSGALARALLGRTAAVFGGMVAAITALVVLLKAAPGDAVDLVTTDPELRARLVADWGLDAPLHEAVLRALGGQWGTSWTLRPGAQVAELVGDALVQSLPLWLGAWLLTLVVGVGWAARRRAVRKWRLPALSAAPVFLLGWGLIVALNEGAFSAMGAGLLERPSWFSLPDTDSWLRNALAVGVLAVGSGGLRSFIDSVRSRLDVHRRSPAVEALVARGQPVDRLLAWLLVPDLAVLAAERGALLFGGLVVVERVFAMPGAGGLFWEACVRRDQPVVVASGVVAALGVAGLRWLADVARVVADPRLRGSA